MLMNFRGGITRHDTVLQKGGRACLCFDLREGGSRYLSTSDEEVLYG